MIGRAQIQLGSLFALLLLVNAGTALAQTASQRNVVRMLSTWGLIGDWSLDCSQPASQQNGYLNYVIQQPGVAMHTRYFGTSQDSHEVIDAQMVENGGLALTVRFLFDSGAQTRRWVLIKRGNQIRAISNVNVETGAPSIRDGKFVHNGAETPWQTLCATPGMTEGSTTPK